MYRRTGEMMNNKAIYRKPNGQYFLARSDAATRDAYVAMGYKITDKTGGVALVMTPRIEVPASGPDVMTLSEKMTQPSVARRVIDLAKNRKSWTGTATELHLQIGDGKINQLFQPGIMEMLDRSGVTVTRWRTAKKRLINVSSANVTT